MGCECHQAIAFAIAGKFCRKRPFTRPIHSENEIFAILFTKPFTIASKLICSTQFATFCLKFGGQKPLANFRGASKFAFAFAAVSLATAVHSEWGSRRQTSRPLHAFTDKSSFEAYVALVLREAPKTPENSSRSKVGSNAGFGGSLKVGQSTQIPILLTYF